MTWIFASVLSLTVGMALPAIFLIWKTPGQRLTSEQIAETGLVLLVPVFGAMISFALSYHSRKDRNALDSDPTAVLAGSAGGAISSIG